MTQILLPHSGYKNLIAYQKSDVIYQGTVLFCHRFLPPMGDRTVDQMTQAARSCKQNIAEGSVAAATSLETQLRLTNVARASLDELLEDYLDHLKAHGHEEWPAASEKKTAARKFARAHAQWIDWKPILETRPDETVCNLMIVLIQQTRYLLNNMLKWQENDFKAHGGVRERMYAARNEARAQTWDKAIYSFFSQAISADDLDARLSQVIAQSRRTAQSIAKKNAWRH